MKSPSMGVQGVKLKVTKDLYGAGCNNKNKVR